MEDGDGGRVGWMLAQAQALVEVGIASALNHSLEGGARSRCQCPRQCQRQYQWAVEYPVPVSLRIGLRAPGQVGHQRLLPLAVRTLTNGFPSSPIRNFK